MGYRRSWGRAADCSPVGRDNAFAWGGPWFDRPHAWSFSTSLFVAWTGRSGVSYSSACGDATREPRFFASPTMWGRPANLGAFWSSIRGAWSRTVARHG